MFEVQVFNEITGKWYWISSSEKSPFNTRVDARKWAEVLIGAMDYKIVKVGD